MNTRIRLSLFSNLINPIDQINDPIHLLLSSYNEIINISKSEKEKMMQFLFFNRKRFHNILYDIEESYNISNEKLSISELLYLSLLILEMPEIINYTYSIDFLRTINTEFFIDKELKPIRKIILAKIMLILISNFKGEEEYDEDEFGEETEKMENETKNIITNNLNIFNEFNMNFDNEIYYCKIENIYVEIIGSLIKHNKFNDYNYCMDIIEQIDIENININKTIFEGLSNILNSKENYMNIYNLTNISDLLNENKINFYYILIKFILKNSYYIYNIDFLNSNIKKFIKYIKIIFEGKGSLINNDIIHKDINNKKITEILEILSIKYYYNLFTNFLEKSKKIPINQGLERKNDGNEKEFVNSKSSESDSFDNETIEQKIEFNKAKEILTKLYLKINISPMENDENQFSFKEITYGKDNQEIKDIKELKLNADYENLSEKDKQIEGGEILYKNYKKFVNFMKEIEDYIKHSEIKFNPQIILEIFKEEKLINEENNSNEYKDLYNITCKSTFINQLDNNYEMTFKDENILVRSINGKSQGFINLINELTNDDYTNENFKY